MGSRCHDTRPPAAGTGEDGRETVIAGRSRPSGAGSADTGQIEARPNGPLVVPAKVRVPVTESLPRERLEARLGEAFRRRLTLVVAPAGSGKTTLVARFATTCGAPVAWYRAETWDADEASFVRHLEAALLAAIPDLAGGWATVDDAARSMASRDGSAPVLLVIDDFYALEDTAAEAAFGRLIDWAPAWLTLILATRVAPSLNLSRLRLSGGLLEIGTDDLRFRAWEVEQLFRDVYHDPVPPADLAVLARRTEGWAAGLQLFHLATRGRSAEERRRVLGGPGSSGRLLREYLAQNVMVGLPGGAARVPHGHLRPGASVRRPVRPAAGHVRERGAPGRPGPARHLHRPGRGRQRRLSLSRGAPPAPRPNARGGDR